MLQETFAQSNKTPTPSAWKNKRAVKHSKIIFHGTKKKKSADKTAGSSLGFEKNMQKETQTLFSLGSWVEAHSGLLTSSRSSHFTPKDRQCLSVILGMHAATGAKGQVLCRIVLHLPSQSCLSLTDLASEKEFSGLFMSVLGYFTSKFAGLLITLEQPCLTEHTASTFLQLKHISRENKR